MNNQVKSVVAKNKKDAVLEVKYDDKVDIREEDLIEAGELHFD